MGPRIATTVEEVRAAVRHARGQGMSIGLVPTMGALHEGHASLMRAARLETDFVVTTIFVNPTQFGPKEDLARYPRPFDDDVALCAREGVGLIFHPTPATIYPPGYRTYVEVEELTRGLCGAARPGHFRGVATVVLKLFLIAQADVAFFGQKDAQQCRVIEQMAHDLNVPTKVQICPTVREPDGLALSSRNRYLGGEERQQATVLVRALRQAEQLVAQGERSAAAVEAAMRAVLATAPLARVDYAAVVDALSLQPIDQLAGKVLLALAVFFGSTRLIDNALLTIPEPAQA